MVRLGRQSHFVCPIDEMGREMSCARDALRIILRQRKKGFIFYMGFKRIMCNNMEFWGILL